MQKSDVGNSQPHLLFDEIDYGAEFYFSEEDYLSPEELNGTIVKHPKPKKRTSRIKIKMVSEYSVKAETSPTPSLPEASAEASLSTASSSSGSSRRPRRSAASTISYVVPDSDDEAIADDADEIMHEVKVIAKKRKVESNLQKWIKHLTALLKDEQRKVCVSAVGVLTQGLIWFYSVQGDEETRACKCCARY